MNILVVLLFGILTAIAQKNDLIEWKFTGKKISEHEARIQCTAKIKRGYIIYDSQLELKDGPLPTTIFFSPEQKISPIGPLEAVSPKKKFDPIWNSDITYFENKGTFTQLLNLRSPQNNIMGTIKTQVCSEKNGQCVLIEEKFKVAL